MLDEYRCAVSYAQSLETSDIYCGGGRGCTNITQVIIDEAWAVANTFHEKIQARLRAADDLVVAGQDLAEAYRGSLDSSGKNGWHEARLGEFYSELDKYRNASSYKDDTTNGSSE